MVVRRWNLSESMIRDKPKSAISKSASSAGVLKRRFSGYRIVDKPITFSINLATTIRLHAVSSHIA